MRICIVYLRLCIDYCGGCLSMIAIWDSVYLRRVWYRPAGDIQAAAGGGGSPPSTPKTKKGTIPMIFSSTTFPVGEGTDALISRFNSLDDGFIVWGGSVRFLRHRHRLFDGVRRKIETPLYRGRVCERYRGIRDEAVSAETGLRRGW